MNSDIEQYVKEALIRSTPELSEDATDRDFSEYLERYDEEQAEGVLNNIKGITHELYYEHLENTDGDAITAQVIESVNNPGSDVILTNVNTGQITEVQLKATDSSNYINETFEKYPEVDILTTEEIAERMNLESTGVQNFELTGEVQKTLSDLGMEGFDDEVIAYMEASKETVAFENDMNIDHDTPLSELSDFLPDVTNAFLTGGYLALLDMLRNSPEKQRSVMKVGLSLGILDGYIDYSAFNVEDTFDINPLLIASVATWIAMLATSSKNNTVRTLGRGFTTASSATFQVIEVGSYFALGTHLLDVLTPGIEITETVGGVIDTFDAFDLLADGSELLDAGLTLGVGLLASRGVKAVFKGLNKKDQEHINKLNKELTEKEIIRNLLKMGAPAPLLVGPIYKMG